MVACSQENIELFFGVNDLVGCMVNYLYILSGDIT